MKYFAISGMLFLFALSGCGGSSVAHVAGNVTLDGKPLPDATVTFHPASGTGAIAYGLTDADGNYTLSTGTEAGLPPGEYVATVQATTAVSPTSSSAEPTFQLITPARYHDISQSGLQFAVVGGKNKIPLPLVSE